MQQGSPRLLAAGKSPAGLQDIESILKRLSKTLAGWRENFVLEEQEKREIERGIKRTEVAEEQSSAQSSCWAARPTLRQRAALWGHPGGGKKHGTRSGLLPMFWCFLACGHGVV